MKSRNRIPGKLSDSANQRLDAYAVAAGGATNACGPHLPGPAGGLYLLSALGLVGLAQSSEAKIVYTPANVLVQGGGTSYYFRFDLNHDGKNDIGFSQGCVAETFVHRCWLDAKPVQGNGVEEGTQNTYGWAAALKAGESVGPADQFNQAASVTMASTNRGHDRGYWFSSKGRYLGVAFRIKGKTHYGWMRFQNSSQGGATLTGYAYETVPGKSIKAGQRKGPDDFSNDPQLVNPDDPGPGALLTTPIPETLQPASLGTLALGAQGVPLWRRKEEVGTAK